jgi:hypothetical protein
MSFHLRHGEGVTQRLVDRLIPKVSLKDWFIGWTDVDIDIIDVLPHTGSFKDWTRVSTMWASVCHKLSSLAEGEKFGASVK